MEPERKIEKLLRAYAKKRRADAGDSLELHPSTRKVLQDAVARRAAKPEGDDSLSLWQLIRQQWIFLTGFALVFFFLASMFLPALSSAKKKAQSLSALSNLKQIGVAAQMAAADAHGKLPASLDVLTNQLLPNNTLIDPQSGKPFVYVAAGKNLATLRPETVLAFSPENKHGRAVLLADGSVEYAGPARFSELTNEAPAELAMAKTDKRELASENLGASAPLMVNSIPKPQPEVAEVQPPPEAPVAASPMKTDSFASGTRNSPQFAAEKSAGLKNFFRNTSASAKTAIVLANFQMQPKGNALRVVDEDGSVYDGYWQTTNVIAQNSRGEVDTIVPSGAPAQNYLQNAGSNGGAQLFAQRYYFQVTGTNLTLKQNVMFSGDLMVLSGAQQDVQNNTAGNRLKDNVTQQNLLNNDQPLLIWSNARIAGTAVIANTNRIEVNASTP